MSVARERVSPSARADGLCLLHAVPGRMRVHLPGRTEQQIGTIEARFRQVPGVRCAQANPLTGNVLIHFDPAATC